MSTFAYTTTPPVPPLATIGMVVLQADQTLENDFQRLIPADRIIQHVTRIPSDLEVTFDTLSAMRQTLPQAVSLFPQATNFDAVGYGCTSGTSVIGPENIASLIKSRCKTKAVTEPVSALIAACKKLDLNTLAFLSPYVEEVSTTLRATLKQNGIATPVFGSFNEEQEKKVVQIDRQSIIDAAITLGKSDQVDAIFLSCTNLKTLDVIAEIEAKTSKPVLSSNQTLAWHICQLAGVELQHERMGTLLA